MMRNPLAFLALLCLVYALPFTWAQSSDASDTAALLAALPDCALKCLVGAVADSTCAATPTNKTCLCTDAALNEAVTLCVASNCTIRESLTTKNLIGTNCNAPIRERTNDYNQISIILGSLSGFFLALRLGHKLLILKTNLTLDDWAIIITVLCGIPSTVMNVHGLAANGLGQDLWMVPFDNITRFVYFFYVMEILYFAQVTLLKMSILFFYLRIFPSQGIRRLLWATVAFNMTFGTVFVFVAIFQCDPIPFYWMRWDNEHVGSCYDVNAMAWANAGISIALDCWMLAVPLSQLRTLKLHWKRKIGVGLMFGVGMFVTVVSILRLSSLVTFGNSQNPTWDQWDVGIWSTVEINVGIICACMPSLRLLLVSIVPRLAGTTHAKNSYYLGGGPTYASKNKFNVVSHSHVGHDRLGSRSENSPLPSSVAGIVYSKSYAVDYGDDTNLVPMGNLHKGSGPRFTLSSKLSDEFGHV